MLIVVFRKHFLTKPYLSQSFRSTPQGVNLSLLNDDSVGISLQVEAKYPALLFKQQLTAYVEKIYGMIRDNLKKEISPLLGLCIQVFLIELNESIHFRKAENGVQLSFSHLLPHLLYGNLMV